AKDALIAASRTATDTEIDILERVATTLYHNSFPVARARLRWAAEQYPEYRALIEAATPTTDPRTYNPDVDARPTPTVGGLDRAARDHEPRRDDQPPQPRHTAADVAARREAAEYLDTRADVDADSRHLPLPEGVPHRYYNPRPHDPRPNQTPLDYDLAAIPDTRGFDCVHCGLERAKVDATPPPGRRGDDGLCSECRDNNAPAIPDHEPHEYLSVRCAHIATTYLESAALTMLRRDWRSAATAGARQQIENWVAQHLTAPAECPLAHAETTLASTNLLFEVADDELAQRIDDLSRRLALADTEAMLYGPAQPQADESSVPESDWLMEELGQLQNEQQRRSHLTTYVAEAEGLLRRGTVDSDPESDIAVINLGPDTT
ncbi:hypothetical protein ACFWWS_39295, partial [Streptomyces sp. NPDC059083]|uniref:hypothetical protein n=1 Tax=Streptomyces sp. NPDC059083 TaxID=3346721 RepID=UPI00369DEDEF